MLRQFLLLWVLCALTAALPQNKKSVETESTTTLSTTTTSCTTTSPTTTSSTTTSPSTTSSTTTSPTTTSSTTTSPTTTSPTTTSPTTTSHITISPTITSSTTTSPTTTSSTSTSSTTTSSTTTSSTTASSTTTSLTTTSSTTESPLTTTTDVTTSTTEPTSTTVKPKSKVINIKHAADLTNEISKAGDKLVVIFVMETWCGHSLMIEPTVEEVARSTENLIVLKVVGNEVDASEDWKYGVNEVTALPTFSFWKKGTKLDAYASSNAKRLKKYIAKNMIRMV